MICNIILPVSRAARRERTHPDRLDTRVIVPYSWSAPAIVSGKRSPLSYPQDTKFPVFSGMGNQRVFYNQFYYFFLRIFLFKQFWSLYCLKIKQATKIDKIILMVNMIQIKCQVSSPF